MATANWHHHFHPKSDPVLQDTFGGRALRAARIQLVPATQHNYSNEAYHHFYAGPVVPTNRQEQFGMAVLSCAGYVPEYAIDLAGGEPQVRQMTPRQLDNLRMKPEIEIPEPREVERFRAQHLPTASYDEAEDALAAKRTRQAEFGYRNLRYGYDPMKAFFADIVVEQDVSHLPGKIVTKFLTTCDETEGLKVLAQAAVQAVETTVWHDQTVDERYRTARKQGSLHPKMPPSAASLIKYKLGDRATRTALLPQLRSRML